MAEFVPAEDPEVLLPGWSDIQLGLSGLGFLDGEPSLGTLPARGEGPVIEAMIRVSRPPKLACEINETERVWIIVGSGGWFPPQVVLARTDLREVPHADKWTIGKKQYRLLCLTRDSGADWWVGKGWGFLLVRCKEWLEAAAAGTLVKSDDPYEPRFQHGAPYTIELPAKDLVDRERPSAGCVHFYAEHLSTNKHRLVVGRGDIPVCVFYQSKPSQNPWPSEIYGEAGLRDAIASFGTSPADLVGVLARQPRAKPGFVVVLFGIRRPKGVLGASSDDEWIGVVVERDAEKGAVWRVSPASVKDRLTPQLAASLNGRTHGPKPAKVLLISAGSLGGYVGQSLIRSGCCELHVVDDDSLQPHNASRHAFGSRFSGMNKAELLGIESFLVYDEGAIVARGIGANVLQLSADQMRTFVEGFEIVIDCSASIAVQYALSELQARVPVLSAFQIARGRGTIVLGQPASDLNSPVTLRELELGAIGQRRLHPVIQDWLAERVEPIQIGAGCRSISARVPDSMARLGAAWVAELVLESLEHPELLSTPRIGLLSADGSRPFTPTATWIPPPEGQWYEFDDWRVWIDSNAAAAIRGHVRAFHPNETAGILTGRHDPRGKRIHVLGVSPPPTDNRGSPMGCVRGRQGIEEFLARRGRRDEGGEVFVGEWHGHPPKSGTGLSPTDRTQAAKNLAKGQAASLPALILISNGEELGVHLLTGAEAR